MKREDATYSITAGNGDANLTRMIYGSLVRMQGPDVHSAFEITVFFGYEGVYHICGRDYDFRDGDIFIIPGNAPHTVTALEKEGAIYNLYFEPQFLTNNASFYEEDSCFRIFRGNTSQFQCRLDRENPKREDILELIDQISLEFREKRPGYKNMIRIHIQTILVLLHRYFGYGTEEVSSVSSFHEAAVGKTLEYINRHYCEDIRLEELGRIANLNPSYYGAIFKRLSGVTPMEYITAKRIAHAIDLLKSGEYVSMLELAFACGFHNTANFNRAFRKLTGEVPSRYVNMLHASERLDPHIYTRNRYFMECSMVENADFTVITDQEDKTMTKLNNMFFDFRYVKTAGDPFQISSLSEVVSETAGYAYRYAVDTIKNQACGGRRMKIELFLSFPAELIKQLEEDFQDAEEAYALWVKADSIGLYSGSERGLIYAVSTLYQLLEENALSEMLIFDYPDTKIRGYRVYTPGRKDFEAFKKMVDMLVYYKYNAMIIEIGGAMEYKKHPEINAKWEEFCTEVNQSPYEARRIQMETHPQWAKNSIHADNGGGSFITQDEMKEIIAYCREREIEVIPEVPSLSHSDYIVMAHPDLNERKEDTYPDTYCPSNPKSYEILFDILDEVIEVFHPEYINIGHDECYTLAKCEKCKGKAPADLYVEDIIKINNYLNARNIKSMMWGEKVYGNVYVEDEKGRWPVGGTGDPSKDIPRLADCAGKIPKNVALLQWYWSLCSGQDEKEICDMGYRMIYGNFRAVALEDYRERMSRVDGGYVSNWGSPQEEYMQRNGQNYSLLTTAWIFWSGAYDNSMSGAVNEKVKKELYKRYLRSLGKEIIEVIHTTDHFRPYKVFYDGYYIVPEEWIIGWHVVTYEDGTAVKLPVTYGYNIRCGEKTEQKGGRKDKESTEGVSAADREVWGATYPIEKDGRIFYKTAYTNPHPDKKIQGITYVAAGEIAVEAEYML